MTKEKTNLCLIVVLGLIVKILIDEKSNEFICILWKFLNYGPLSQLMQGAGMAVLTILISFAIGIFIQHLGDKERKGSSLDLHVALDYVWKFKPSLIIVSTMVVVPFFMGIGNVVFRSIIFILWLIAFLLLFSILLNLYNWVKGDKDKFRLKYLSDFPKSSRDNVISWRDWWTTKQTKEDRFVEKDFFIAFSKEIDSILCTNDKIRWEILPKLLEGFLSNIDNRNKIFLLVFEEFFPKILDWHFLLWQKQYSKFAKNYTEKKDELEIYISQADGIINQIIKYVTKEALLGKTGNAFSYFKHLDSHIKKYEKNSIEGSQHTYLYIENIPIYNDCLDFIPESTESHDILGHYFLPHWKITVKNLKDNLISKIWCNNFMNWAQEYIQKGNDEWNKNIDEISKELFPFTDPSMWAKILTFVIRPWSGKSRMQAIVEKGPNFGYIGRIVVGDSKEDIDAKLADQYNSQEQETIKLALYLFKRFFTKDNLDKWLDELKDLHYEDNSKLYYSKIKWEHILILLKDKIIKEQND